MTELTGKRLSTPWLVMSFIGIFICGYILMNIVIWLLGSFFESGTQTPALGVILVFLSGSLLGQYWFSAEKTRPAPGRAWLVSILCGLVTLALQAATFWLALQGGEIPGAPSMAEIRSQQPETLAMLAAGLFVFGVLVIRLGVWWGLRQGEKLAARQKS